MGEKEDYEAAAEARRDTTVHAQRPWSHEEVLMRFLSGAAYRVAHERSVPERSRPEETGAEEPS